MLPFPSVFLFCTVFAWCRGSNTVLLTPTHQMRKEYSLFTGQLKIDKRIYPAIVITGIAIVTTRRAKKDWPRATFCLGMYGGPNKKCVSIYDPFVKGNLLFFAVPLAQYFSSGTERLVYHGQLKTSSCVAVSKMHDAIQLHLADRRFVKCSKCNAFDALFCDRKIVGILLKEPQQNMFYVKRFTAMQKLAWKKYGDDGDFKIWDEFKRRGRNENTAKRNCAMCGDMFYILRSIIIVNALKIVYSL